MANPATHISIVHDSAVAAQSLTDLLLRTADDDRSGLRLLGDYFAAAAAGARNCKVIAHQESDGALASQTVTVTVASCAAGDWLYVGPVGLRCITGAVTALRDTWTKDTGDTEGAVSLAAAINNNTFLAQYVTATSSSAVVTITSKVPGPIAQMFVVRKEVATAAGLKIGGLAGVAQLPLTTTGGTKATATITCVFANLDDNDTVTIAGKVLTGDTTTPADADEFVIDTDDATVAASLAAAINAAEEIRGHVYATVATNVVTMTAYVPGTGIDAMTVAAADADGTVVSGATMTDGATHVQAAPRTYNAGVA